MPNEPSRGPEVGNHEFLLRAIVHPDWWNSDEDRPSSAILGYPQFSAFVDSIAPIDHAVRKLPESNGQFPDGSGVLKFGSGAARELKFDVRLEPEHGDDSHANVYCELNSNQRKKHARKLLEHPTTSIAVKPILDRLRASRSA